MTQHQDPSFEYLLNAIYHECNEEYARKHMSMIDPNYVYNGETLLGLMAQYYDLELTPYVTTELINDLIERTDPIYFTPHTGSPIHYHRYPFRLLLRNSINSFKGTFDLRGLSLIRKMIAKMDFSLPDSVQLVQDIIVPRCVGYNPLFTALLIPDLVLKGALIYTDAIRIMNREQDIGNRINLLYLFNKANIRVDAGIVDELFEFV